MLGQIDASARAERIWLKILRKPSSIIFTVPEVDYGDGTTTPAEPLDAQTVRIVYDNPISAIQGESGVSPIVTAIVYGVRGHPNVDIADTDIDEGYEFEDQDNKFRVKDVIPVPGGVQAVCIGVG